MNCKKCGSAMNESDKFCQTCGEENKGSVSDQGMERTEGAPAQNMPQQSSFGSAPESMPQQSSFGS
ncbi:MAG: hypothetical protein Q4A19_06685, partial [Johnsonella sp.]|nr:hypothetical protein [Johnsonella sp.]